MDYQERSEQQGTLDQLGLSEEQEVQESKEFRDDQDNKVIVEEKETRVSGVSPGEMEKLEFQ